MSDIDAMFEQAPKTLNVAQAAALLGVSRQLIQKWITQGVIPAYRLAENSHWFIFRDELKAAILSGRNGYPVAPSKISGQVPAESAES